MNLKYNSSVDGWRQLPLLQRHKVAEIREMIMEGERRGNVMGGNHLQVTVISMSHFCSKSWRRDILYGKLVWFNNWYCAYAQLWLEVWLNRQAELEKRRCGLTYSCGKSNWCFSITHANLTSLIKHCTVNGNLRWDHFLTVSLTHALKPFFCTLNKTPRSRSLNCLLCLFALPAAPSSKDLFVHK